MRRVGRPDSLARRGTEDGEHGADEVGGVRAVVRRAKRRLESVGLFRSHGRPAQKAIDHDQCGDFFGSLFVNAADDRRTHAVSDERGFRHVRVAHDGQHCSRKVVHAVMCVRLIALSVAR